MPVSLTAQKVGRGSLKPSPAVLLMPLSLVDPSWSSTRSREPAPSCGELLLLLPPCPNPPTHTHTVQGTRAASRYVALQYFHGYECKIYKYINLRL